MIVEPLIKPSKTRIYKCPKAYHTTSNVVDRSEGAQSVVGVIHSHMQLCLHWMFVCILFHRAMNSGHSVSRDLIPIIASKWQWKYFHNGDEEGLACLGELACGLGAASNFMYGSVWFYLKEKNFPYLPKKLEMTQEWTR